MTAAGRQATRQRFDAPLAELIAEAAASRDSAHSRLISYSRNVFSPLMPGVSASQHGSAHRIGREPMQRDTLYRPVPEDRRAASMIAAYLEPIVLTPPRKKAAVG